ncbi:MAG: hypothetical protein AAF593_00360 [Planctomycetota bacterium]
MRSTTPTEQAIGLLAELRSAGVTLTPAIDLDGPAERLDPDTLARVRHHKPALLRLLVNPYCHTCVVNPQRQQVCDRLADAYDRDPLWCADLARRWYSAMDDARRRGDADPDASAWDDMQKGNPR